MTNITLVAMMDRFVAEYKFDLKTKPEYKVKIVFSPNGKRILTTTADETASLRMQQAANKSARLDGNRVLTGSDDSAARLCDIGANLDIPGDFLNYKPGRYQLRT
jgi:hypothetical protein